MKILTHRDYDPADVRALKATGLLETITANRRNVRMDSADDAGIFFARQLDYIKAQLYNVKYPENHALSLFPVSYSVNPGAQTVSWRGFDRVGASKILAEEATDIPRVAISGIEKSTPIRTLGNFYSYSLGQMEAARFGGLPLDAELAKTSRLSIDQELNRIAWVGDAAHGLAGVLSPGNFPTLAAPSRIVDMTPMQILAFVRQMISLTAITTMSVERPDTWAVPTDVFIHLIMTRFEDGSDMSIATWLKNNTLRLKEIIEVPELNADSDTLKGTAYEGVGTSFFYSKDENSFSIEVPLAFDQTPPQPSELAFKIFCRARTAGALIYYPMSALIVPGV